VLPWLILDSCEESALSNPSEKEPGVIHRNLVEKYHINNNCDVARIPTPHPIPPIPCKSSEMRGGKPCRCRRKLRSSWRR